MKNTLYTISKTYKTTNDKYIWSDKPRNLAKYNIDNMINNEMWNMQKTIK